MLAPMMKMPRRWRWPGMPGDAPLGNILRRTAVFGVGLFVVAFGIAVITRSDLGTSPISAPPFVYSLTGELTFGEATFVMLVAFVVFQVLLLRRRFSPLQFLQLPAGLVFSAFIDVTMWMTAAFEPEIYVLQLVQLLAGILILGLGVAIQVTPRLTYLPGEGIVVALVIATGRPFNYTKVTVDSLLVVVAIGMSFALWGELRGLREGTVIAAVLVGFVVGWIMPYVKRIAARIGALPPPART